MAQSVLVIIARTLSRATSHQRLASVPLKTIWNTSQRSETGVILSHKRFAGHSHWQNIRHIKGARDMARSKAITNFVFKVNAAIRENQNDMNPATNIKLDRVIKSHRSSGSAGSFITEDIIRRTLERAKHRLVSGSQSFIECKGPGGCAMVLDVTTDSIGRLKNLLRGAFKRTGGQVGVPAKYAFDEKGVIDVEWENEPEDISVYEEIAIHSDCEDVLLTENDDSSPIVRFLCEPLTVQSRIKDLEKNLPQHHAVQFCGVGYLPHTLRLLNERDMKLANALFEKLSENMEINRWYSNIDFSVDEVPN